MAAGAVAARQHTGQGNRRHLVDLRADRRSAGGGGLGHGRKGHHRDPADLPRPRPAPASLTNFFPIGVWAQYAVDFPKWRARGINMVSGVLTYPLPPHYATWRQFGGHDYLFVLNTSPTAILKVGMRIGGLPATAGALDVVGENRCVQLNLHEQFVDKFQPYELHVYKY